MIKRRFTLGLILSFGVLASTAPAADSVDTLTAALTGGKPSLDLRLRAEHVDNQGPQPLDANALTLRTRLGYTTGLWNGFDLRLEYEGVSALDKLDYNSTLNGQAARPPIADPPGNELNQAWLRYSGVPGTGVKLGRQRYVLDKHRFVGNVGWRQNEQTFDGLTLVNRSLPDTELSYAYFHNANTIVFTNAPMKTHLLNASYAPAPWLKATLYGYLLDFTAPAPVPNTQRQDTQTVGLRAEGGIPLAASFKLVYAAEYAQQSEYADAPAGVDADYWALESGLSWPMVEVKAGIETLASDDGIFALQTPLATLHAFNGWADLFLTTPANGLRDRYASLSGAIARLKWMAVYHRFEADFGGADYGDEIDAQLLLPLGKQLSALVKYANYRADTLATDTEKGWVQFEFKL